jgi:hypothetical protein
MNSEEIDDLFSMFHDFDIVGMEYWSNTLLMTLRIPWGEMWGDFDFQIKVRIDGCSTLACKYFEFLDTSKNLIERETIDKFTSDPKVIETLGLDIQRFEFTPPNKYLFHCNGYDKVGGGEITITADGFQLFDNHSHEITLNKMKNWGEEWWSKIFNKE